MTIQDLWSRRADINPGLVLARVSNHAPFWVSLVCVSLLGWYLARLVWLVVPAPAAADWTPPAASAMATTSGTRKPVDYRSIVAAHLFGQAAAGSEPLADEIADAPDTSLSLQLRGAIAATDTRFAHAIIADSTGNTKVYFSGDSVPGGATLHRVEIDRVVLSRDGQFEALRLPREGNGAASIRATPPQSAAESTLPVAALVPPVRNETMIEELVAQTSPGLLKVINPRPYMPGGKLRGYRIYPGTERKKFRALGLRAGDLVREINGVPLTSPAQAIEVFKNLGDAPEMTLALDRYGKPMVLLVNLAQADELE